MKINLVATNEWFRNEHLLEKGGHYALTIYMILQKMQQLDGKIVVSIGEVITYMVADRKNETMVSNVKGAMEFLAQEELIMLYEDIHMSKAIKCDLKNVKTGQILYIKIRELPTAGFTQITIDELNTIMSIPKIQAKKKAQILSYFIAIVMHIDAKTKLAFPSFDKLQEETRIGRRDNCKRFNETLKEMGLLVYGNAGVANMENTGYVANTYARAEHEAELKTEIMRLRETKTWKRNEIQKYHNADMKRSLKQKINRLQQKAEQGELKVKEQRQLDELQEQYNQLLDGKEMF